MQNLLLDCKKIIITFSLLILRAVVLGFTALQYILAIRSAVSSNHAVSSSVNVSTYHKSITPLRRNIFFFQMLFSYDKIIPVSAPLELLKEASSFFAIAENILGKLHVGILIQQVFIQK